MKLGIILCLVIQLTGCTVITVVDAAASAVVSTVETVVDWVIPD
jgi:hypothetical protein